VGRHLSLPNDARRLHALKCLPFETEPRFTREFGGSHGDPEGARALARDYSGSFPPLFAEGKSGLPFETEPRFTREFGGSHGDPEGARALARDYSGSFPPLFAEGKSGLPPRSRATGARERGGMEDYHQETTRSLWKISWTSLS
jgi:hypothetical protein